jgi:hypothetical protein
MSTFFWATRYTERLHVSVEPVIELKSMGGAKTIDLFEDMTKFSVATFATCPYP